MNSNLTVIENELVPVYETSAGEKVVYGSELYESLGSKRQYTDWIKGRLLECDAVKDEDYQSFSQNSEKPAGGRPKSEYIIKLDTAKEMAMLERNEKGKQVRRYFIEIEKKYKENPLDSLSTELKAVIVVDKRVTQVEHRIEKLENNMTVSHEMIQTIKNRVNKKVTDILGGYESNAYRDKHIRGKVYSRFNKDYCDYFRINARANTLASKFEGALSYIDMWAPDTNLMIQIKNANAQLNMEVS